MNTRTRRSKSIAAGVVTLVGAAMVATTLPAIAVQNYIATPLGWLGGTEVGVRLSGASAINASGQVTGSAWNPTAPGGGAAHAFIHANGAMIDLGTLGGPNSYGSAINNSGQVTGYSETGYDVEGTVHHAFLYSNGTMTDLGTLGGRDSAGRGINAMGQVVGTSKMRDFMQRAFLYSNGTMTQPLGTLGGPESSAAGINDSGQVAGYADVGDVPWPLHVSVPHAFLISGGAMIDLGTLGGRFSYATGINNAGEVTGYSFLEGETTAHAFLYYGGRMIDLGTLGGTSSYGYAINNSRQVTGESDTTDNEIHAFLYTDGKIYDLNSLVTNDLGPGVVLQHAEGINDRGQIAATGCTTSLVPEPCQAYRLDPITSANIPMMSNWMLGATAVFLLIAGSVGLRRTMRSNGNVVLRRRQTLNW